MYNLWQGFKIEETAPGPPVDIDDFLKHCTVIMEGDQAFGDFLLDMLAHRVQRPGERIGLGLVVLGKQGLGKTTFFKLFCEALMYPGNFLITEKSEQIVGKFHLLAEKILLLWEEAEAGDTHSAADRLKHLITTESEWSEKKGQDAVNVPMCFLPVVTANSVGQNSVKIESSDRRWCVVRMNSDHLDNDNSYFDRLYGKMMKPAYMRAVFEFLQSRDISKYRNGRDWSKHRPETETYNELKRACRHPLDVWFDYIAETYASDHLPPEIALVFSSARPETSADSLHSSYCNWLQTQYSPDGKAHSPTRSNFRLQLATRADNKGEPWCTKKKNASGVMRYQFDIVGLVKTRLGENSTTNLRLPP